MGIEVGKAVRIGAILVIAGLAAWAVPHLDVVRTPSIRYSLLWAEGGPSGKGDYVRVPVRSALIHRGAPEHLTKRIGCVAGDTLTFRNGQHYCNGEWLDRVLATTVHGAPLTPWRWDGPIPAGKVYLVGDDPRSVDSRYLGFFDHASAVREFGIF